MHIVQRIEQSRDDAKRTARRSILVSPIAMTALGRDYLEQIQEREEALRWLLNSRPRKMNRCARSKSL